MLSVFINKILAINAIGLPLYFIVYLFQHGIRKWGYLGYDFSTSTNYLDLIGIIFVTQIGNSMVFGVILIAQLICGFIKQIFNHCFIERVIKYKGMMQVYKNKCFLIGIIIALNNGYITIILLAAASFLRIHYIRLNGKNNVPNAICEESFYSQIYVGICMSTLYCILNIEYLIESLLDPLLLIYNPWHRYQILFIICHMLFQLLLLWEDIELIKHVLKNVNRAIPFIALYSMFCIDLIYRIKLFIGLYLMVATTILLINKAKLMKFPLYRNRIIL